jgi:hypothetical protein
VQQAQITQISFGNQAGYSATSANSNFIGYQAGYNATSAYNSNFFVVIKLE